MICWRWWTYSHTLPANQNQMNPENKRRISIVRSCMVFWIRAFDASLYLVEYQAADLWVACAADSPLSRCNTWTVTEAKEKKPDICDMWCLKRILRIPYMNHVSTMTVRERTVPVSATVRKRRLGFTGKPHGLWKTVTTRETCAQQWTEPRSTWEDKLVDLGSLDLVSWHIHEILSSAFMQHGEGSKNKAVSLRGRKRRRTNRKLVSESLQRMFNS